MDKILDPKVKASWIEALRSNKYKQGEGALERDGCNCCLGVLCKIYPNVLVSSHKPSGKTVFSYGQFQECNYLPPSLAYEVFGNEKVTSVTINLTEDSIAKLTLISTKHGNPNPRFSIHSASGTTLATLNDLGWTFPMIADVIEEFL